MKEWWKEHSSFLAENKLNKKNFERIISERSISFKDNIKEIFDFLKENNISTIVISGSGSGEELILMMIEKNSDLYFFITIRGKCYRHKDFIVYK